MFYLFALAENLIENFTLGKEVKCLPPQFLSNDYPFNGFNSLCDHRMIDLSIYDHPISSNIKKSYGNCPKFLTDSQYKK